jgi:ABC-2 type transport system permease protein
LTCFKGIVWREVLRYLHQRERFLSALVRPLVWLFIFAAGFRQTLGVSIIPPYETYVLYEVFIAPGLIGMIQLFNAMQSSLSMVYDRETICERCYQPLPPVSAVVGRRRRPLLQVYAFLLSLIIGRSSRRSTAISPCCRRSFCRGSCSDRSHFSCPPSSGSSRTSRAS